MPPGGQIMHKHMRVFQHLVAILKRNLIFNDVEIFLSYKFKYKEHSALMVL